MLPTTGPNVIVEHGYDSGVLDVGDGYVVTVHIEVITILLPWNHLGSGNWCRWGHS